MQSLSNWIATCDPFARIDDIDVFGSNGIPCRSCGFITWDEGNGRDIRPSETCWDAAHANATAYPSCSVATLVISPYTPPTVSTTWFNHYNLLQATEAMLGLPALPTSKATGGVPTPNDARVPFNL